MARVLIATQSWSPITRNALGVLQIQANTLVTIANTDASAATTWSAQTGGSSSTAAQLTDSNGNIQRWIDEGEYDITVGGESAKRVEAVAGGVRGIVIKSASDDLQAALTRAGTNGGVVSIVDGLDYTFSTLLAVPAKVVLQLGMGTTLSCTVTGGGNAITLGAAAMIRGASGGGGGSGGAGGSRVRAVSGANIGALITNAAPNQEYVYLRDLFIAAESGSTVRSLVDFVGVFFNSGMSGCVLDGATVATNCLRVRSSGTTQFGQLTFYGCWFNRAAQDCVLIEGAGSAGGGSVSGRDVWFTKCIVENWGIGTDVNGDPTGGMKITAPTGLISDVVFRDGHIESGTTAGSASQLIWAKKVVGLAIEQTGVFLSNATNYSGVVWTNNTENQGGRVVNLDSNTSITKLIDDQKRAYTLTDTSCDVYYQGGRSTQTFQIPSLTLPSQTAAATSNNTLFLDSADTKVKFKDSGGVAQFLYDPSPPSTHGYLAWTHPTTLNTTNNNPTAGKFYMMKVLVPLSISVTSVSYYVQTIGATLTSGQNFVGILNSSGTVLGTSADQTTNFGATGLKTAALTGGPFAITGGGGVFVWVVFLSNGTTTPKFACTGSSANPDGDAMNAGLTPSTALAANQGTGQTALASLAGSLGSNSKYQFLYWAGLT
jgi:hypothetical protein